jgi:hypothetical protein
MHPQRIARSLRRALWHFGVAIALSLLITITAERAAAQSSASTPPPTADLAARQVGDLKFRLLDISFDALFAAGGSTEHDASLGTLQGGGHDPRKRGATVQNIELAFTGAVDPYLRGQANIIYFIDPIEGESLFELEEAFASSQTLPAGLQLKAGQYFTDFGRVNAQHPHQWEWQDQPIINTRLFGPDGMRGAGAQLSWLLPTTWYATIQGGVQNANGETMTSFFSSGEAFEERPIGGRPFVEQDVRSIADFAYSARLDNFFELAETVGLKLGASWLTGPNSTGAAGRTHIWGVDTHVKWQPAQNRRGWPFVIWQTEVMGRNYRADDGLDPGADLVDPADDTLFRREDLRDWGLYSQVLHGFVERWAAGVRYEFAGGTGTSDGMRESDPFRADRHRIAPLVMFLPTEYSRFRLQYNYDDADHLDDGNAHSVWLGFEFLLGAHAAHKY